ncbi:MAG: 30S ribosomal protein S4 [Patescibacteria group bacterium]
MIIKTKYKISRRLGAGVFEKCQTQKFALSEARKSANKKRGRRKMQTEYGRQLIEKQKMRFSYGIREKQLSRYVKEALANKIADPSDTLYSRLESRLDNVVYRLGLAPTRAMARQMVSHGHITLNSKRNSIASCEVKMGDVIGIRKGSLAKGPFAELGEKVKGLSQVKWLSFDLKQKEGKVIGKPQQPDQDIFDIKTILEFYGR